MNVLPAKSINEVMQTEQLNVFYMCINWQSTTMEYKREDGIYTHTTTDTSNTKYSGGNYVFYTYNKQIDNDNKTAICEKL